MYYYLSFLRPPPKTVSLAQASITITPQIANDLRTELKEDKPTDIYYTWQNITPYSPSTTTPPVKLTTYNPPASTYKALTIPLPPHTKASQTWRIGLFSPPAKSVQGSLETLDEHVCGVWSDGITILSSNTGNRDKQAAAVAAKQTRVFREWLLPGLAERSGSAGAGGNWRAGMERGQCRPMIDARPSMSTTRETQMEETLKVVEQTSFDLDKKIWDSGLALSAWLQDHLLRHDTRTADNSVHPLIDAYLNRITTVCRPPSINVDNETDDGRTRRTIRVVELGAGTGLVSFALASAVRRRWRNQEGRTARQVCGEVDKETPMAYEIYATDLESALPLIDENAALNSRLWASADEAREVADSDTAKDGAQARDIMSGQDVVEPKIEILSEVLDWEEDLPSWVHRDTNGHEVRIDIVIAADVTYNTASFPCLIETLTSLLNPAPDTYINKPNTSGRPKESSPSPLLLLAYKERDASERELWELAKENGIWMELVDVIRGHEAVGQSGGVEVAGATEIWIGGMGERP